MRKPVFAICKQQRRRSACASAQSDQRLSYSLLRKKVLDIMRAFSFISNAKKLLNTPVVLNAIQN